MQKIYHSVLCTNGQKKEKKNINSNTNYRGQMKLMAINIDCTQLQFDAFQFFLGFFPYVFFLLPNINFFPCKSPSFSTKLKSLPLKLTGYIFYNIFDISFRVIRRGYYN